MLNKFTQFITWPAIAGILGAIIILQWQTYGSVQPASPIAPTISFANAVRTATPSVVNIYTSKRLEDRRHPLADDPFFRRFLRNNNSRSRVQRSLGSGVIISSDGLILTNRHVIAGADEILISLQDGRESLASVVGSDKDTDLAVLQVQIDGLQAIDIGDADKLAVGDVVLAIGNPYGLGHSVTQGIVSALGRYGLQLSTYEDYIQTDAAVNQGNSGGALINASGELIGINTAIYSETGASIGIGLAIPSDLALQVMNDLANYGKVIRGWMGLEVQSLLAESGRQVLQVTATAANGPADRAGIQVNDMITHIDMQRIVDGLSTRQQIALLRPGDAIDISLLRGDEELLVQATVGLRPESQ